MKPRVVFVAGARPNFVKIAPVLSAIERLRPNFEAVLVHTGQHYSPELSQVFFDQLGIRPPDVYLEAGSGGHADQTAAVLRGFEAFLLQAPQPFRAAVVVGDVNSTLAAALAAAKLQVGVIHLEAGLRSFDRGMPEEVNRVVTDAISDLLLVSEPAGEANLLREGVPPQRIRYVGNVMIDTLQQHLGTCGPNDGAGARSGRYALVTMHRPANVDDPERLATLVEILLGIGAQIGVIFSVHPRTRARLQEGRLWERLEQGRGITLLPSQGYLENLALMRQAAVVLTDSGGVQEETTHLNVPCLTLRGNTERPVTVTAGTNTLVGLDLARVRPLVEEILAGGYKSSLPIPGWDGHAAPRVVAAVAEYLAGF